MLSGVPRVPKALIQKFWRVEDSDASVGIKSSFSPECVSRSKFGFGSEERDLSGAHMDLKAARQAGLGLSSAEAHVGCRGLPRQNSVRLYCGLRRAGATGGGRDGKPRESRILRATTGSSMTARIRMRERHRGHSKTSSANTRAIN
jgi:hypothetical protein